MTGAARAMSFGPPRRPRRPSLTPMIDVVFLLLVFFMLAARFGAEGALTLTLAAPAAGADWSGPPRLVEIAPGGAIRLNGVALAAADLPAALAPLMAGPEDPVVLRAVDGAATGALVAVLDGLRAAGFTRLAVVE
ncbi:MAG: biopolymer transporter ExbD [Rhodobacteraceae bacterium]|nr:biopolymer transporter ExbD [Paracoccaceae bacterium]